MNYRLTPEAEQDLRDIWSYTRTTWGLKQANNYLEQLKTCFMRLCEHPELGRSRDEVREGYRSIPQKQHVVFYRYHEQQIEVVRVLHRRMEIDGKF
ncbi:MAG: type II toxin-antitoxin system RelE/ParE family toxin [Thiolinea sp.]